LIVSTCACASARMGVLQKFRHPSGSWDLARLEARPSS
jgi:hypothetical protein